MYNVTMHNLIMYNVIMYSAKMYNKLIQCTIKYYYAMYNVVM